MSVTAAKVVVPPVNDQDTTGVALAEAVGVGLGDALVVGLAVAVAVGEAVWLADELAVGEIAALPQAATIMTRAKAKTLPN